MQTSLYLTRVALVGLCASLAIGASAGARAQWAGLSDESAALGTDTFSFTGTRSEQVNSNENYYDGDFGDFDGDGVIDRTLGARYGLLHNTGGGLMTPFAGYTGFLLRGMPGASGWGEDAFQWADVDGDGDLDHLSGGNGEPLTLQINDEGRFRVAWQMPISALNIVSLDLENDGDVDFAIAHSFCSDLACGHGCPETGCAGFGDWPKAFNLLINDGSGSFTVARSDTRGLPAAETLIMDVAAGDIDGDRDVDLVFLNGMDRRVNVARNDGTGRFTTTPIDFGVPVRSIGPISSGFNQGMNLGDVDRDGDLDIVLALDRDIGTHPRVGHAVFINGGGGAFTETSATAFDVGAFSGFIRGGNGKLLDVDYDGDLDFIAFDRDRGVLDVFIGDGGGRFAYDSARSIDFGEGAVALGNDTDITDLDGDGAYDIWVGSGGADPRVLLNRYEDPSGIAADVPREARVESTGAGGVTLSWRAPVFAATARAYRVYRATSPSLDDRDRRLVHTIGRPFQDEGYSAPITASTTTAYLGDPAVELDGASGTIHFTDASALPGVTYYYAVSHVGAENTESRQSPEVMARIPAASGTDTTGPAIDIVSPGRQHWSAQPRIVVHYGDGQSGIDMATLRVSFDRALGGRAAGSDLTDLAYRRDLGAFVAAIPPELTLASDTLVTMTVSIADVSGNTAMAQAQFFVSVTSASPPAASFVASATSGDAPLSVELDGSASRDADGKLLRWEWYFGDGTTALGRIVTHRYTSDGTYQAMLLVRDNDGGIGVSTMTITVGTGGTCSSGATESCYTGPAGTGGVGACRPGSRSCVSGAWGICGGEVQPTFESCDNGLDDDCDGAIDRADVDCGGDGGTSLDGGASGGDGGVGLDGAAERAPTGASGGCGCRAAGAVEDRRARNAAPVAAAKAIALGALATLALSRRRRRPRRRS